MAYYFRFALVFCALGMAACSILTAPPAPEAIQGEMPVASAAPRDVPPLGSQAASQVAVQKQPAPPPSPAGKLEITDVTVGKGPEVKNGDTISVHYTGTLRDGSKFDSSRDRNAPFDFQVGGRVIDGWNKGVIGMKPGGKRKLVIPYQMAYGEAGSPPKIPPRSELLFDIELLKILPPRPPQ